MLEAGYQNPQVSRSFGPVDPTVSLLAVRSVADHRPLAVFANYSLHYVGGHPAISADYFAVFAEELGRKLNASHRTETMCAPKSPFTGPAAPPWRSSAAITTRAP